MQGSRCRPGAVLLLRILVPVLLLLQPSFSQASSRLAVMDLRSQEGVTAAEARTLSGLLRTALHETGAFTLINREDLEEIARNYEIELTVCEDDACLLRLGALVGAQLLVTGDVGRVFDGFVVNLRLVDLVGDTLANRAITSEVAQGNLTSFQKSMIRAARTLAIRSDAGLEAPRRLSEEPRQERLPFLAQARGWRISSRAGLSMITGMFGLELQSRHLAIGAGYLYYYGHGIAGGIRYYFEPRAASWFVGLGVFHSSPAEHTEYERETDLRNNAVGLHGGRRWPLGDSWDIAASVGVVNLEHMGSGGELDIRTLGYVGLTLGFGF